jgi:hypothetical protein
MSQTTRPVLREDINHEDIQGGVTLEHLVDNTPTTLHRLFSSSLRVLMENNISLLRASALTVDPKSLERTKAEFTRDVDVISPHTKALLEEGGLLPFDDVKFVLAVSNMFINMSSIVEHVVQQQERQALKGMFESLTNLLDKLPKTTEGGTPVVVAGSPEEVRAALEEMGKAAEAKSADKPPVH